MADLPSASEIAALASLIAPGLIILGIRGRFRNAGDSDLKDKIIAYAVASAAYYAGVYPIFHVTGGIALPVWLWKFLQYFLVPIIVAVAVIFFDQGGFFYKFCTKFGLRISHHIPSAWDFAFSQLVKGTFVLVKLNDGTLYGGLMGRQSFASSSAGERDLYIQEVWTIHESKAWVITDPPRSVLLCGRDIRWVEIFHRR